MIKIHNKKIDNFKKTFIIAEIGLSHEGSLGLAKYFVDLSVKGGADAVKFQMHLPDEESSRYEKFRIKFSSQDETRYDYWKRTSFTLKDWKELANYCKKKKIIFLCSPFSILAAKNLNKLSVPAWKIASGEFNNKLLLKHISLISKKPFILSTGLSDLKEIQDVVKYLKKIKAKFSLLQCTSEYPTDISNVGHSLIEKFKNRFKVPVGISDHSGNFNSIIAGISMGAAIIEFHVVLERKYFGPDSSSSITFDELKLITAFNSDFYKIKNSKIKKINSKKLSNMKYLFNKSLTASKDIKKGSKITIKDLKDMKPNIGISTSNFESVIGKKVKKNIKKGSFFSLKYFA
tara:strand:- start:11 stop:1048 length:1038 start_codon:yes stop_codon:yes gene_type:complete